MHKMGKRLSKTDFFWDHPVGELLILDISDDISGNLGSRNNFSVKFVGVKSEIEVQFKNISATFSHF